MILLSALSVSIKCDDNGTVYADGANVFSCINSLQTFTMPRATRVVAIRGGNGKGKAYIVAGFSSGFKTLSGSDSDKWKCIATLYSNWDDADYDDSEWSLAADKEPHDVDFVTGAIKIWTDEVKTSRYVYCRGHMGERTRIHVHVQYMYTCSSG